MSTENLTNQLARTNHGKCRAQFRCPKSRLALSEAQINPAPIMITSFKTNRPAPDKYGFAKGGKTLAAYLAMAVFMIDA